LNASKGMPIAIILPRVRVWLNDDGPNFSDCVITKKKADSKARLSKSLFPKTL
jgi:hypothetical protein